MAMTETPEEEESMADEKEIDELMDRLLQGLSPEEIVGRDGLLDELTMGFMNGR